MSWFKRMDSSNLETGDDQLDNDVMEQVLPPGLPTGGREPPDAKSLRYADRASAMQK